MPPSGSDDVYTELDDDYPTTFTTSTLSTAQITSIPPPLGFQTTEAPDDDSLPTPSPSLSSSRTKSFKVSTVTVSASAAPIEPLQAASTGNPFPTDSPDDSTKWENLTSGKRAGIVIGGIFVIAAIIGYCFWKRKCCFKRRGRRTPPGPAQSDRYGSAANTGPYGSVVRLRGNDASHGNLNTNVPGDVGLRGGDVALSAVSPTASPSSPHAPARTLDPDAPPPSYYAINHDTIVPPSEHHRIAGQGDAHTEEEFNVVADGKMPLSEIPFEDVDVNALHNQPSSSSSSSASRDFHQLHRYGGGDTTGHTNS